VNLRKMALVINDALVEEFLEALGVTHSEAETDELDLLAGQILHEGFSLKKISGNALRLTRIVDHDQAFTRVRLDSSKAAVVLQIRNANLEKILTTVSDLGVNAITTLMTTYGILYKRQGFMPKIDGNSITLSRLSAINAIGFSRYLSGKLPESPIFKCTAYDYLPWYFPAAICHTNGGVIVPVEYPETQGSAGSASSGTRSRVQS